MFDYRIVVASVLGAASLGVAGCASTDGTQLASADGEGDPTETVCRRIHEVGSRLSSRQCKTRAEWDAEAEAARDAMERNGRIGVGDAGGPTFGGGN